MVSARQLIMCRFSFTLLLFVAFQIVLAGERTFQRPLQNVIAKSKIPEHYMPGALAEHLRRFNRPAPSFRDTRTTQTTPAAAHPDSILVYSILDTTRHLCAFEAETLGNDLILDIQERLNAGAWEVFSRYSLTKTRNGNREIDVFLTETYEGGNIEASRTTIDTRSYSTGKDQTTTLEDGENGVFKNESRQLDTSDNEGLNAISVAQLWEDGRWANQTSYSTTIDSTKKVFVILSEQWSNGEWAGLHRATQTFNSPWPDWSYNLKSELDEIWLDDRWVNDYRVTTSTIAFPPTYQEMYEQWVDSVWQKSYRVSTLFDNNQREIGLVYETWDAAQWVNYWRMTWRYDPRGNILSTSTFHAENGLWVEDDRTTTTYNNDDHVVELLLQKNAAGQLVNVERFTYAYDTLSRCFEGSHEIYQNSQWEPWDGGFDSQVTNGIQIQGYHFRMSYPPELPTSTATEDGNVVRFALRQNYPNPFNPSTIIRYSLPHGSPVVIAVFNTLGQRVTTLVNEYQEAGEHTIRFDANGLASGMYFYRLSSGPFVATKRLLLLR